MIALDLSKRAARMMEAGRVTVTFRSPSGNHITLVAKSRGTDENGKWVSVPLAEAKVIFVEVPNETGFNDKVGKITRRAGFVADPSADTARVYCAKALLAFLAGEPTAPGLEIMEESRCGRCGRQLTDPVSIERGIGPECYGAHTGSHHQVKGETATAAAPETTPFDDEVATGVRDRLDFTGPVGQAELRRRNQVRRDSRGVPMGVGDWRQRKTFLDAELRSERKQSDRPCSQGKIFPETGDDIPY